MSGSARRAVMWFRRDLRLADNPALIEAVASADEVVPLFVLDPALWRPAGRPRQAYLIASLEALGERIGGLVVRRGDPVTEVASVVRNTGATSVHVAADFGPYGRRRDDAVENALADLDVPLVRTGSPYAVTPGRVVNKTGDGYLVYTPFARAWREHGWRLPPGTPRGVGWHTDVRGDDLYRVHLPDGITLPVAGEEAARRHWRSFVADKLASYADGRDRPDLDVTSHMSVHLKWGEIHPRTMLADLDASAAPRKAVETYRNELAWREFYADVLGRRPETAREYYKPEFARMPYAEPDELFDAWCEGRTGYPIVDAGMRQLNRTGYMHNRLRMISASFLTKDLGIDWRRGERYFAERLNDYDLASNNGGWQWAASTGCDAQPYFRIFNPVTQSRRFDEDGAFIRRYVPELDGFDARHIHAPWQAPVEIQRATRCVVGVDYPVPLVDHAEARARTLRRYAAAAGG